MHEKILSFLQSEDPKVLAEGIAYAQSLSLPELGSILGEILKGSPEEIQTAIRAGQTAEVPPIDGSTWPAYHNREHTASVALAYTKLRLSEPAANEDPQPILGLIAALLHDAQHPGGTNASPSELEQRSVRASEGADTLSLLPAKDQSEVKSLILATAFREKAEEVAILHRDRIRSIDAVLRAADIYASTAISAAMCLESGAALKAEIQNCGRDHLAGAKGAWAATLDTPETQNAFLSENRADKILLGPAARAAAARQEKIAEELALASLTRSLPTISILSLENASSSIQHKGDILILLEIGGADPLPIRKDATGNWSSFGGYGPNGPTENPNWPLSDGQTKILGTILDASEIPKGPEMVAWDTNAILGLHQANRELAADPWDNNHGGPERVETPPPNKPVLVDGLLCLVTRDETDSEGQAFFVDSAKEWKPLRALSLHPDGRPKPLDEGAEFGYGTPTLKAYCQYLDSLNLEPKRQCPHPGALNNLISQDPDSQAQLANREIALAKETQLPNWGLHKKKPEETPAGAAHGKTHGRTLVAGDIHGNLDALNRALETAQFQPENGDRVFLVGDIADRGPQNWETFKFILLEAPAKNILTVKGNHDQWAQEYLEHVLEGGPITGVVDQTLTARERNQICPLSWLAEICEEPKERENLEACLAALKKLPIIRTFQAGEKTHTITHAAPVLQKEDDGPSRLATPAEVDAICSGELCPDNITPFLWNRSLQREAVAEAHDPASKSLQPRPVWTGHTPQRSVHTGWTTNLDTAAGHADPDGRITLADVKTGQTWEAITAEYEKTPQGTLSNDSSELLIVSEENRKITALTKTGKKISMIKTKTGLWRKADQTGTLPLKEKKTQKALTPTALLQQKILAACLPTSTHACQESVLLAKEIQKSPEKAEEFGCVMRGIGKSRMMLAAKILKNGTVAVSNVPENHVRDLSAIADKIRQALEPVPALA